MKIRFPFILSFALACVGATSWAETGMPFPRTPSRTLNGMEFVYPDDFGAQRNIILLAFNKDMIPAIDAWDAMLSSLRDGKNIQIYKAPIIPNPGAMMRKFISDGLSSNYTDSGVRDRTSVLFVDERNFLKSISVVDRAYPLVLVTDQKGVEVGRVQSLLNETSFLEVKALLQ